MANAYSPIYVQVVQMVFAIEGRVFSEEGRPVRGWRFFWIVCYKDGAPDGAAEGLVCQLIITMADYKTSFWIIAVSGM